jgi:hypothetical protein
MMTEPQHDKSDNKRRPVIWPGMPTRGSQSVESLFVLFPIWLVVIGFLFAVLMAIVQSCRV